MWEEILKRGDVRGGTSYSWYFPSKNDFRICFYYGFELALNFDLFEN